MQRSKTITKLAQALAVFAREMGAIKKDTVNTAFNSKYASLSTILDNIAGPLEKAELVITQWPVGDDSLETMLVHAPTGQFMSSVFTMKGSKDEPTDAGGRISYMKRYSLAAVLSLNIVDERTVSKEKDGVALVPEDEDAEWMDEGTFHKYIKRMKDGEFDAFGEACRKWKISDAARAELKKAHDAISKKKPTIGAAVVDH